MKVARDVAGRLAGSALEGQAPDDVNRSMMPAIPVPWAHGAATVAYGKLPALDNASTCMCLWDGVITITDPGQERTAVSRSHRWA